MLQSLLLPCRCLGFAVPSANHPTGWDCRQFIRPDLSGAVRFGRHPIQRAFCPNTEVLVAPDIYGPTPVPHVILSFSCYSTSHNGDIKYTVVLSNLG